MLDRYRPSGRFGVSTIATLVGACVLAVGVAWPYQKLVDVMPLIYVEFLITMGFGLVLGTFASTCLLFGRSRSPATNAVGVVLVALAGWVGSFLWDRQFLHAKAYEEAKSLPASEGDGDLPSEEESLAGFTFAGYIDVKTETGWTVGRVGHTATGARALPIQGFAVYLVWLLEGGLIGTFAWRRAMPRLDRPFCESCGAFAGARELRAAVGVRLTPMRDAADAGDLVGLASPKTEKGVALVGAYQLHECPTCRDGGWLDVETVLAVPSDKGKTKFHRTPVVRHAVLSRAQRDAVVAARERVAQPAAPPTGAASKPAPKTPSWRLPSDG